VREDDRVTRRQRDGALLFVTYLDPPTPASHYIKTEVSARGYAEPPWRTQLQPPKHGRRQVNGVQDLANDVYTRVQTFWTIEQKIRRFKH
jgi:hypothetical protein